MSIMPPPTSFDVNETRQPELYAASLATYTLAVIAVNCRFLSRRLLKIRYGLDDWFSLAALLTATGFLVSTLVCKEIRYGKHYQTLHFDFVTPFFKNLFVGEILYCLTITFAKFSILCFCWRIFSSSKSIRPPIYILSGIVSMWTLAVIFMTIFQCKPVSGFWNRTKPAICNVDSQKFFIGNAIPNILTDVALMVLPLPYIWQLNRSKSQKIALAGVFLLGGFVIIVSIVRCVILVGIDLKSVDLNYNFAPLGVWTETEANIAILCACLPSCRPILSFILTGSLRPTGPSGGASNRGSGLSWLFKSKGASAASKKDSDLSYPDGDSRRLVARPKVDHAQPWMEATNSQTTVSGPTSGGRNPWGSEDNTAQVSDQSWYSGKRTGERQAARSGDDIEMQTDGKLGESTIVVKNDFDVRYWTANGKQGK
ncbi:MAG: hypothetical protein L6R36_004289 [Xanthoria steineri]|nr:MAG: hypothetical protein L6R36_004289 [Xanthoria steineri]